MVHEVTEGAWGSGAVAALRVLDPHRRLESHAFARLSELHLPDTFPTVPATLLDDETTAALKTAREACREVRR